MSHSSPAGPENPRDSLSSLKVLIVPGKTWFDYDLLAAQAYTRGSLAESIALWEAALTLAEDEEGNNAATSQAHLLEQLVCAYYDSEDMERAEAVCKRALIAVTNVYGSHHPKSGNCLNNLAGIYFRSARYSDAESVSQSVVAIYESYYGSQHPEVGLAMHNLAMIYQAQGKNMHAERYYRRAYSLRACAFGAAHPSAVKVIISYTAMLESTGRALEAQRIRTKVAQ